jgi:hypothetical protein
MAEAAMPRALPPEAEEPQVPGRQLPWCHGSRLWALFQVRHKFQHCMPNDLQHRVGIVEHLMVPETEYHESQVPNGLISTLVIRGVINMLPTIQLYDQTRRHANEVSDVSRHGYLAPELETHEAAVTE